MVKKTAFLPSFDESFLNYGFNKVQWIENLRYLGYEFYVATNAFRGGRSPQSVAIARMRDK